MPETCGDGLCGLECELLVDNRVGEGTEFIVLPLGGKSARANAGNHARQHRVSPLQVAHSGRQKAHRGKQYPIARHCESRAAGSARPRPGMAGRVLRTGGVTMTTAMERLNYFNYFTEIEEYFWRKRGAHILVSPLDWAIVETWQKAGIPLEAVLKGIDRAFESFQRSRRGSAGRPLKSLVYCVDAVLEAAEEAKETSAGAGPEAVKAKATGESFSREELRAYLRRNAERLRAAAARLRTANNANSLIAHLERTAARLVELEPLLDATGNLDLEDLERRLTVLEEKLIAALTAGADEAVMLRLRTEMDRALAPYRRRMTAEQLALLERQYVQKRLFEEYAVPRLSLFYLA